MKYDHLFNSETTLYEKKYDTDQEITVLFEKENVILRADSQGNAVFFDTDGNEIQSGKAQSDKSFGFIFCIVNKKGITVRFPVTETIDHYPNCDGEYDRYSERIIDNITITCPIKQGNTKMKKILFIGNSYTYFNDMPKMFRALATENGFEVRVDAVTKGGRKLYENLIDGDENKAQIIALCKENQYDILFLQEQSYLAIVDYPLFEKGIKELIQEVKPKKTILYSTWGRKEGSPVLNDLSTTREKMTFDLAAAYDNVGKSVCADVSHVGKCFWEINKLDADIELYNPDLTHPSYEGSCVAAICHYKHVFGEMPKSCKCFTLDEEQTKIFTKIIEKEA